MASFQSLKATRNARQRPLAKTSLAENASSSSKEVVEPSTFGQPLSNECVPREETNQPAPLQVESRVDEKETAFYGNELNGLVVRWTPGKGRGLFAGLQSYKAGTSLINTTPIVCALSTPELSSYCSNCFLTPHEIALDTKLPPPKLKRCTGCQALYYCSFTCQKADWPNHQSECRALKRMHTMHDHSFPGRRKDDTKWILHDSLRGLARVCWARKKARDLTGKDPDWWESVARMESHRERANENEMMNLGLLVQRLKHFLSAADPVSPSEIHILRPVEMEKYGFKSDSELLDLCSSFKVNSFTLSSPNLNPIGVATSPLLALCNHACEPNASVVFPDGGRKGIELVAIRDILPGEEILNAYVDVSTPFADRQQDLKDRYGFECDCLLCKRSADVEWVDPRWCVKHVECEYVKDGKGKGKMPDLRENGIKQVQCDSCGKDFPIDVPILRNLVNAARGILKAEESRTLDESQARDNLRSLVPALQSLLPSSSHPLLPLIRLYATLLVSQIKIPQDIYNIAGIYAAGYTGSLAVYPLGHPSVAIILSEWAKDLITVPQDAQEDGSELRKRLKVGCAVLRNALQACLVAFGRRSGGGLVGREIRYLLEGCQAELDNLRDGDR